MQCNATATATVMEYGNIKYSERIEFHYFINQLPQCSFMRQSTRSG